MKVLKQLLFISCSGLACWSLLGEETVVKSEKPKYDPKKSAVYCRALGYMNFLQSGFKNLNMNEADFAAFIEGIRLAKEGKKLPENLGEIMEEVQAYAQDRFQAYEKQRQTEIKTTAAKNRESGEAFLKETLAKNPAIQKAPSGLAYQIKKPGNAVRTSDEDTIEMFYTGKLIDGTVFDKSDKKAVTLALKNIIPGIKEGVGLIGEMGEIVLYIPDNLAYGEYDIPDIPAGSMLIFEIKLQKIIKPVKEPAKAINSEVKKPN